MTNDFVRTSLWGTEELPIENIYERLRVAGFPKQFVKEYVLPDWWDDELSANPATHAIAEVALMRKLKLSIDALRNTDAPLRPEVDADYKLKAFKSAGSKLLPSLAVAQSVAESLVDSGVALPSFRFGPSARDVRADILQKRNTVDLEGLLGWAWSHGIIVAHLKLPEAMKRFAGIAMVIDTSPVILLASNYKAPAWLAFHLAHEIGHLLLGHVRAGELRVDEDVKPNKPDFVNSAETDEEERTANEFALMLLTDRFPSDFRPIRNLTAEKLYGYALEAGRDFHVDPGTYALICAHSARFYSVAQDTLKLLGMHEGAQELVDKAARYYLPQDVSNSLLPALHMIGLELDKNPCLLPVS